MRIAPRIGCFGLALLSVLSTLEVRGQGVIPSKGKEFWLGFMRNWGLLSTSGSLDVFISGDVATSGVVSIPASGLSWPFTVTPGTTTSITVPMAAALHSGSETVENKGVLVSALDTVSVFAINYEPQTADGTVVYPVEALGIDHRIVSYTGINTGPNAGGEFLIVATKDGTEVEITTSAMTLMGQAPGVPWVVALDSGQTYQVRAVSPTADLTGSTVRATEASGPCRPFAVFSGSACSEIPSGCWACDHLYEQHLPVGSWGTTYHAPPFAGTTSYAYRVLAHENGTQVSINGAAPITLNAGDWHDATNATAGACFQGDRPFLVAQFMKGMYCAGSGDPSMLLLNAQEQVIDRITFSTVISTIITQHQVNVVVATADIPTITLDGTAIPAGSFLPFPSCPDRSYAQVPITPGSHTLACPNGFSAYVYGTGQEESYAYSVGSFTPVPPPPIFEAICGTDASGQVVLATPHPIQDPAWTLLDHPEDTLFLGDSYAFTPTHSALYAVTGTELVSRCPVRFVFSVELEEPPVLTLTAGASAVCAFTPVPLQVDIFPPGEHTVQWSPATTLDDPTSLTPTALPMSDTWYRVEVSTLSGCASAVDSVFVAASMGQLLDLEVTPADTTICAGAAVGLSLSARQLVLHDTFDGGSWGPGWAQVQGAGTSTACGSVSGDALYFNGGIQRQATTVDLDLAPGGTLRFALKIGQGIAPCENADPGDDVRLEFSTNGGANWTWLATYLEWGHPEFTPIEVTIPAAGPNSSIRFRWHQSGTWTTGTDNWALDDVVIARNGAVPSNVTWTPTAGLDDATSATPLATPLSTTTYTAQATDASGLCAHTAVTTIVVTQPFPVSTIADTVVCSADGLQLWVQHAVAGATVQWQPAGALSSDGSMTPTVLLDSTTTYTVRVTAPDGCMALDTVVVTVPFSDLLPPLDTTICAGSSLLLDPEQPEALHAWSTGANSSSILVEEASLYSVVLTDPIGCTTTWQAQVSTVAPPVVDLGPDTAFCNAEPLVLQAPATGIRAWSDGSNGASLSVTTTGVYWLEVTDGHGCATRDSVHITVHPMPEVHLSDTTGCIGSTLQLVAGTDQQQYLWSNGSTEAWTIVSAPLDSIGVLVTTSAGCSTQAEVALEWLPYPTPDLGPDTVLCAGTSLQLQAGTAANGFLWSTGATTSGIPVVQGGTYVVIASNGPCARRDSIRVEMISPPPALLPNEITFCPEEPPYRITLVAGALGLTYVWSAPPGQPVTAGPVLEAQMPGTYSVVVMNEHGCRTVDAVDLVAICPGSLYVPNAFTPDGDGLNEVFRPVGRHIEELELFIFDRWGELLLHANGPQAEWDGRYAGEPCQDGVYPWRIRYRSVDPGTSRSTWKDRFGHVTLLR